MSYDIQANVIVGDKISNDVLKKLDRIGASSELANAKVVAMRNSLASINSINLSNINNQLKNLAMTNPFKGMDKSMLAVINSQQKIALENTKLALAQEKLRIAEERRIAVSLKNAQIQQQTADKATLNATKQATAEQKLRTETERTNAARLLAERRSQLLAQANERLNRSTRESTLSLRAMGNALLYLSKLQLVGGKMIDYGDTYQRSVNKLQLIVSSAEEAKTRLSSLTQVAINSYSGIESTVSLYTRLDMALRQVGGTSSEAIQITETLSKTVALAGLTTAEANSALLQISQAFNKGKLDGDEFRTVMETMPPLADAIARKLGVTRGELLELAPKGKITAQVMRDAILDMSNVIDDRFSKLTPTIGQQLEALQVKAQMFYGALWVDSGFANGVNFGLQLIGDNLKHITILAGSVAIAMTAAFVTTKINSFIKYLSALRLVYKGVAAEAILASKATSLLGKGFVGLGAIVRASPLGVIVTVLSLLGAGFLEVLDLTGKPLFPNLDQDKQKLEDFNNRISDITNSITKMNVSRLAKSYGDLQANLEKTNEALNKAKFDTQALDRYKQKIEELNNRIAELQERVNKQKTASMSGFGLIAVQGSSLNLAAQERELNNALKERGEILAKTAEAEIEAKKLEEDRIKNAEAQLDILLYVQNKMEENKNLIEKTAGTQEEHNQKVLDAIKENENLADKFGDVGEAIKSVITLLYKLGYAELQNGIYQSAEQTEEFIKKKQQAILNKEQEKENKVAISDFNKIKESEARKLAFKKSDKKTQAKMRAEDELEKYQHLKEYGLDGKKLKRDELGNVIAGQVSMYDNLVKLKQANALEIEAINEHNKNSKKSISKAQKEQERKLKELEKAQEKFDEYKNSLQTENDLLEQGYQSYQRYNKLYELRYQLAQKGVQISDEEINKLKEQIDLNAKLKELAQNINDIEEKSLAKQREKIRLKREAIGKANVTESDKIVARDELADNVGVTYSVNQGVEKYKQEFELRKELLDQFHEEAKISEMDYNNYLLGLSMARDDQIYQRQLDNLRNMGSLGEVTATAFESFTSNATDSLMNVLNGTESITDAMRNLAKTMITDVVRAMTQMVVKWIARQAMAFAFGQAQQQAATTQAAATGASITASMTPAATVSSMATYGSSATAGMAVMMASLAMIPALIALVGKRRFGGSVDAGSLYQVGEGNAPEIFQSKAGKQYMIAGDRGKVFSNKEVTGATSSEKGGITIIQNITFTGSGNEETDNKAIKEMGNQVRAMVYDVLKKESRVGGMLSNAY